MSIRFGSTVEISVTDLLPLTPSSFPVCFAPFPTVRGIITLELVRDGDCGRRCFWSPPRIFLCLVSLPLVLCARVAVSLRKLNSKHCAVASAFLTAVRISPTFSTRRPLTWVSCHPTQMPKCAPDLVTKSTTPREFTVPQYSSQLSVILTIDLLSAPSEEEHEDESYDSRSPSNSSSRGPQHSGARRIDSMNIMTTIRITKSCGNERIELTKAIPFESRYAYDSTTRRKVQPRQARRQTAMAMASNTTHSLFGTRPLALAPPLVLVVFLIRASGDSPTFPPTCVDVLTKKPRTDSLRVCSWYWRA
mmetsp:Transcript_6324/g.8935  ORF Transcript_6324/g.8935 Transcript_6324/m.8935 type:complete len:305 (-) Transcript_6324:363-1277(-)